MAIVKNLLKEEKKEKLLPARGNWNASPSEVVSPNHCPVVIRHVVPSDSTKGKPRI